VKTATTAKNPMVTAMFMAILLVSAASIYLALTMSSRQPALRFNPAGAKYVKNGGKIETLTAQFAPLRRDGARVPFWNRCPEKGSTR
jgi:hypothetical protein